MSLTESLRDYVRACFTGVWIESHEQTDALATITRLCAEENWTAATWDLEHGLVTTENATASTESIAGDPLTAIRSAESLGAPGGTTLLVLPNFHRLLESAEIVQAVASQILAGRQSRTILVVLAPLVRIPLELRTLFVVLQHARPTREELAEIARSLATEAGELPTGAELDRVLDAAAGLTRLEAENALSLALIRSGRLTPEGIWELKTQTLRTSGSLRLHRGGDDFATLGGLTALKTFCRRVLTPGAVPTVRGRGVLLLSPPGCGKSQFCRALGEETGRPVLQLDVGGLLGSLVGQSEQRTREALSIVEAMAPCILMIDEIEKAFSGLGGQGDSGVSARMFGTFLTWLSDHRADVFVVATANDISKLPPEFARSERFDAVFFLDLPGSEEREAIWHIHREHFGVPTDQPHPVDDEWTGAEIRACCRLAVLLEISLTAAAEFVVPIARTAGESIRRLRQWADRRCLSANHVGVYRLPDQPATRRAITPRPSDN